MIIRKLSRHNPVVDQRSAGLRETLGQGHKKYFIKHGELLNIAVCLHTPVILLILMEKKNMKSIACFL